MNSHQQKIIHNFKKMNSLLSSPSSSSSASSSFACDGGCVSRDANVDDASVSTADAAYFTSDATADAGAMMLHPWLLLLFLLLLLL